MLFHDQQARVLGSIFLGESQVFNIGAHFTIRFIFFLEAFQTNAGNKKFFIHDNYVTLDVQVFKNWKIALNLVR